MGNLINRHVSIPEYYIATISCGEKGCIRMKKITDLLIALTLLISCMSTIAFAESTNDSSAEIDALWEQRAEQIIRMGVKPMKFRH